MTTAAGTTVRAATGRCYATCWAIAAGVAFASALVLGAEVMGWVPIVMLAVLMAVLGACFGVAWTEGTDATRRAARAGAIWGAFGVVVVLGLPPALGPWGLLAIAALGAGCPWSVTFLRRELRRRSEGPAADIAFIADRELARRWSESARSLAAPGRTPQELIVVVERRARLLDELERRDPRGFESWLTREGWLEPQDG